MSDPSRILVVDDTPMNAKLLHDVLEVRGYAVETAASGPAAGRLEVNGSGVNTGAPPVSAADLPR